MKKINFITALALFFLAFNITSCSTDVEPIDPALLNGGTGNENGGGTGGGGTTTADYWPMAVNNQWTFVMDGDLQEPMKIISTQQINGLNYYKYNNLFGESLSGGDFIATFWTRKSNGNYYVMQEATIPAAGGLPSITVSPLEIIILKDNLEVNQTWTQNMTQTTTIQGFPPIETAVNVEAKILEKNVSVTINGIAYTNVIKVELIQNTQGTTNTNYYWFAKDIGPVKIQTIYEGAEDIKELSTYIVN